MIPADYPDDRQDLAQLEESFPVIYRDGDAIVLENPNALPRAWISHDAQQVTAEEALALLASGEIDPAQTTLIESEPPMTTAPAAGATESITYTERSPETIQLEVTAASDGLLVLSETYDPGWKAYVDGEKVEILRANYLFRAIPIAPGEHTVELRYEPLETRIGMAISGLTLLAVIPAFLYALRRRRPYGT